MKRLLGVLGMIILGTLAISCSKDSAAPVNEDLVTYDISLNIKQDGLSTAKLDLLKKINNKEAVSFNQITALAIEDQAIQSEKQKESKDRSYVAQNDVAILNLQSGLEDLKASLGSTEYLGAKSKYEAKIEQKLGTKIKYNKAFVTVPNILEEAKKQCFSGTNLNLLLERSRRSGKKFREENLVVIMESGHVLPGKMIRTDDSWNLVGVETTAAGDAIKDYGYTADLNQPMRIIDAELYTLISLFDKNFKDQKSQMATFNEAIEQTAKKYAIPFEKLEEKVAAAAKAKTAKSTGKGKSGSAAGSGKSEDAFNSSLFAFGEDETPAGDIEPSTDVGQSLAAFKESKEGFSVSIAEKQSPQQVNQKATPQECFEMNGSTLVRYLCADKIKNVVIPNSVRTIAPDAFADQKQNGTYKPAKIIRE